MTTDPPAGRLVTEIPRASRDDGNRPLPADRRVPVPSAVGSIAQRRPASVQLGRVAGPDGNGARACWLLLPFALGSALSYLLCNSTALLAGPWAAQLDLAPADLGLLASVLFLAMAAAQIPLGVLLDRLGPRRLQCTCLLVTAAGCLLCATAHSSGVLILARVMIGLGIATATLSGLKAARLWLPPHRLGMVSGVLIASGALGAMAATLPAQAIIDVIGWRLLLVILAAVSLVGALLVAILVPEMPRQDRSLDEEPAPWRAIHHDRLFWKLAPMSAAILGSAWALQGIWVAPWLAEVERLDPAAVAQRLLRMAIVFGIASLALGWLSDRLRSYSMLMLAALGSLSIIAQLSLATGWPLSAAVAWSLIALTGAASTLSFSILIGALPVHIAGRASTALNLTLLLAAFALQWLFGLVVEGSSSPGDRASAFATAFVVNSAIQAMALVWFVLPEAIMESIVRCFARRPPRLLLAHIPPVPLTPYRQAHLAWLERAHDARQQLEHWRYAAIGSSAVCVVLLSLVVTAP